MNQKKLSNSKMNNRSDLMKKTINRKEIDSSKKKNMMTMLLTNFFQF